MIDALDPDFPSVVIADVPLLIGDDARYGAEVTKPDFVAADDNNFMGGVK